MRVRLKGLNQATKRLADGTVVTYWYAWRGGPRLEGKPGSPEFIANYNAAVAAKIAAPKGVLLSIIEGFRASDEYLSLAERTRGDYDRQFLIIEKRFGDLPLKALDDRRIRGVFKTWRMELARRSRRQADYAWDVLRRVINVAIDNGIVATNPCTKAGRLYKGSRAEMVWSDEQEAAFLAAAPQHLHLALMLGLWTGQREGDLLRLIWSAYDGSNIRLKQSKTGRRVTIPVGAPLKQMLDAAVRKSPTILLTTDDTPWTPNGFSSSWRKACKRARISGVSGAQPSHGSRWQVAPKQRSQPSPATRSARCAASWTSITLVVTRRWLLVQFGSLKGTKREKISQTELQTVRR
jgi:integrase